MKKLVFISLLFFTTAFSFAQYSIKGKLIDSQGKLPIAFASVALYNQKDSSLVTGAVTTDNGEFLVQGIKGGMYYLQISFLGYKPLKKEQIVISNENPVHDIGNIELEQESTTLTEVNVKEERLKGVEAVDRTVYAINEKAIKSSNNGLDVLKKIPSIQIDFSNNVSLEGNSNILIMVDGKKRDKEYLAQLNPGHIDKIEVINNPSSKYDSDVSGVINILLKKEAKAGLSGNIETELPTSKKVISNSSVGFDYGIGKIHLSLSANTHLEKLFISQITRRETFNQNPNSLFTQTGDGDFTSFGTTVHYGLDYFINDKNVLNIYGNINPYIFNVNHFYYKDFYTGNTLKNHATTDNKNKDNNMSYFYSLFYKRILDNKAELTSEVSMYNYNGKNEMNYTDQEYNEETMLPEGLPFYRFQSGRSYRDVLTGKIDYNQMLAGKFKFETGVQAYKQWLNNKSPKETDNTTDVNFKYSETRASAYANISGKLKKFNWQLGVRGDNSIIYINEKKANNYLFLLPNLNLQYKIGEKQSFKLTYRRSIIRPNSGDLNPYIYYIDSMSITRGNPDLKPYYSNKSQFTYTLNFGNNYIAPNIYFDYFQNYFARITNVNENNYSESYVDNVARGYDLGAGFTAAIQITKWWTLNTFGKIYQTTIKGAVNAEKYDIKEQQKLSYQIGGNSVMTFFKDLNIIGYAFYNSPQLRGQNTSTRSVLYLLGAEKGFLKQRAKIGVYAYVPFMDKFIFQKNVAEGENFRNYDENYIDSKNFYSIKLSYNFNNGKEVKKLQRNKNIENEGKSMGF